MVVFELRYDADRSARPDRNHARIEDLLAAPLEVLPFTEEDADSAGAHRAYLAGQSTQIEPFDVLIAGQAKAQGLLIATANTKEFTRVRIHEGTMTYRPELINNLKANYGIAISCATRRDRKSCHSRSTPAVDPQ